MIELNQIVREQEAANAAALLRDQSQFGQLGPLITDGVISLSDMSSASLNTSLDDSSSSPFYTKSKSSSPANSRTSRRSMRGMDDAGSEFQSTNDVNTMMMKSNTNNVSKQIIDDNNGHGTTQQQRRSNRKDFVSGWITSFPIQAHQTLNPATTQAIGHDNNGKLIQWDIAFPREIALLLAKDHRIHFDNPSSSIIPPPLPHSITVKDVLNEFEVAKTKNNWTSFKTNTIINRRVISEIMKGIATYFDSMIGHQLLYRIERKMYLESMTKFPNIRPSDLYGSIYLLRLLVQLPQLVKDIVIDNDGAKILKGYIEELLVYCAFNRARLF